MKKLLGAAALAGAAYAGLAAYAAQQGRDVSDVAADLLNRATDTAERAADRLVAYADSLTDDPAAASEERIVDLTSADADALGTPARGTSSA
jgi:hypothetical protein